VVRGAADGCLGTDQPGVEAGALAAGATSVWLTLHWKNTNELPTAVPVFRPYGDSNMAGLKFLAGKDRGEYLLDLFKAYMLVSQHPRSRKLKPGEEWSEQVTVPLSKSASYEPPVLKAGESMSLRAEVALPGLDAKTISSGSVEIRRSARLASKIAWSQAVNGLQGRIEVKKETIAPGEDIQLTFALRTAPDQKKPLYVWDNKYSEGYRNDSYIVKTPEGKKITLRLPGDREWRKNVPHPVQIKPGAPHTLQGWTGATKSLKKLGLDTSNPGVYTIRGVYQQAGGNNNRGVAMWGGRLTTPAVEVRVGKPAARASLISEGSTLAEVRKKILAHGGKHVLVPIEPPRAAPVPALPDGTPARSPAPARKQEPRRYEVYQVRKGWTILLLHDGKTVLGMTEEVFPHGPKGRTEIDLASPPLKRRAVPKRR